MAKQKRKYEPPAGAERVTDFYGAKVKFTQENPHLEGFFLKLAEVPIEDPETNTTKIARFIFICDNDGEIHQVGVTYALEKVWARASEEKWGEFSKYIIFHLEQEVDTSHGQLAAMKALGVWVYDKNPNVDNSEEKV